MSEVQAYQLVIAGSVVLFVFIGMAIRSGYLQKCAECEAIYTARNDAMRERDDAKRRAENAERNLVSHLESTDGYQVEAEWWRERFVKHIEGKDSDGDE